MTLSWGVVPPEAAHLLVREYPELLRLLETRARDLTASTPGARAGQALQLFVSTTRDAAQRRAEVLSQACGGSAEVPQSRDQAGSSLPSGDGQWVTTREAAQMLGLTDRQVRNLLGSGRLSKLPGRGSHRIARWSLDEELERRGAQA